MSAQVKTVNEIIDEIGFGWYQIKLIVVFGLLQTADAMEMLLLSVIGPLIKCEWFLTEAQVALITTVVFIGMGIGAPLFGFFSDRYGRLGILILSSIGTFYFGCLSGFSHHYIWILIYRGCVGMGIGGMMSTISVLFTELTPTSHRNRGITAVLSFWAFGAIFECGLAYIVGPTLGWGALVILSTIPIIFATVGTCILPESPQFLLLKGRVNDVKDILKKVARDNKKDMEIGEISAPKALDARGNLFNMFHGNYIETTLFLAVIWFAAGFSYYGNVLISSTLPETPYQCLQDQSKYSETLASLDTSCCIPLTNETFRAMLFASMGDAFTFPVVLLLSGTLGRRWSLRINFIFAAVSFLLLDLCMPESARLFILVVNRTCSNSAFITAYMYTGEVYPTSIRSGSLGICSAMARLGAIITPFIAQVMLKDSTVRGALIVYTAVALIGTVASFMLPIETKGRLLTNTVYDSSKTTKDVENKLKTASSKEYETFHQSS